MFNNKLIQRIVPTTDLESGHLSSADWQLVFAANAGVTDESSVGKGDAFHGWCLLGKIEPLANSLDSEHGRQVCSDIGFLFFRVRSLFDFDERGYFVDPLAAPCGDFERRRNAAGMEAPPMHRADIGNLPYASESLRLVYGHSFLHHLPDVERYLAEVYRVLGTGRHLVAFHKPTVTAPRLETFPLSLVKDTQPGSLTDIWLIRPATISRLLRRVGFRTVRNFPRNLTASALVRPWQVVRDKRKLARNTPGMLRRKRGCDRVDALLPQGFLRRYAPSIAIVAVK